MTRKPCPDCKAEGKNRIPKCKDGPHPAGRCCTHHRARRKAASKKRHERRVTKTYELEPGDYDKLLAAQGGACAVCRKRFPYRLDVDHDHVSGMVRMLACKGCNRKIFPYSRNDASVLRAAARALEDPIAPRVIGFRGVTDMGKVNIWREVPGYGGWYEVSSQGEVRSWHAPRDGKSPEPVRATEPRLLSANTNPRSGYQSVQLANEGKKTRYYIHRLVLLAFVGECPEGMEACHNNGNRADNRLVNLRWGTKEENQHDRVRHGTDVKGEDSHSAKLTEVIVKEARELYAAGGYSYSGLARKYGVTAGAIYQAVTKKTWKHVK